MNQGNINKQGLNNGDVVDLYNDFEGVERVAHKFIVVAYPIPAGCTAICFPETNVLVPVNSVADKSNTPTSKLIIIRVRKSLVQLAAFSFHEERRCGIWHMIVSKGLKGRHSLAMGAAHRQYIE